MFVFNSIVRRFAFIYISSFLFVLLLINLITFNSADFVGTDLSDTYFGFSSVVSMFNSLKKLPSVDNTVYGYVNGVPITMYLPTIFTNIYENTIGLIQYLLGFSGETRDILKILRAIFQLFILPIDTIISLLELVVSLVADIVVIVPVIFNALFGRYNVPLPVI